MSGSFFAPAPFFPAACAAAAPAGSPLLRVADLAAAPLRARGRVELFSAANGCELPERLLRLLLTPPVCASTPGDLSVTDEAQLLRRIKAAVMEGRPIDAALVCWPFKVVRKTSRRYPDLGELAMIRRLMRIAASVRVYYPPGLRWTVFTETDLFAARMGAPPGSGVAYQDGLSWLLDLSAGHGVTIDRVSLAAVLAGDPGYVNLLALEEAALQHQLRAADPRGVLGASFLQAIWTSVQFPLDNDAFAKLSLEEAMDSPDARAQKRWAACCKLTAHYVAANRVKQRVFGGLGFLACRHDPVLADRQLDQRGLYLSLTQKPGRPAIHAIAPGLRSLPHHGVPVVLPDGQIQIRLRAEAISSGCTPVYAQDDREPEQPFCYLRPNASYAVLSKLRI